MTGVRRLSNKSRKIGQIVVKTIRSESRLWNEQPRPSNASSKTLRIPLARAKKESQLISKKRFEGTEPLPHFAIVTGALLTI